VLLFDIDSGVFIKSLFSLSNGNLASRLNRNKKTAIAKVFLAMAVLNFYQTTFTAVS
jgi:hypothetical protein